MATNYGMSDLDGDEDATPAPPESASETPMTEEGQPETGGETLKVPAEFLQGTQFKPGDELVLRVVDIGDDGELEVAYAKPGGAGGGGEGAGGGGAKSANDELDAMAASDSDY